MAPERLVALGGLVVSLLLLAQLAPPALRAWRIYSGVKTRRLADAGPLAIPPPEPVALRLDADFRVHHGGLTLRPLIPRLIGPAIGAAVLAVLCAALLVAGR